MEFVLIYPSHLHRFLKKKRPNQTNDLFIAFCVVQFQIKFALLLFGGSRNVP